MTSLPGKLARPRPDAARTPHIDEIQGLRALAVLLVVAYHAHVPLIRSGFVGVDVFFVISGFVICRLLLTEIGRTDGVRLRTFYARRVRRLLPALALMLTATVLFSAVVDSPVLAQQETATLVVGASVWLANVSVFLITGGYFATGVSFPLTHTWSLAVEEQFYVIFPGLIALCAFVVRRGRLSASRRRATYLAAIAIVGAVSLLLDVYFSYGWPGRAGAEIAFYTPVTRAWEFAAGALVALCAGRLSGIRSSRSRAVSVAGAVLVCGSAVALPLDLPFPGWIAIIPVGGTALLIAGVLGEPGGIGRLLRSRTALWIGDTSYSWYLWHWPFIHYTKLLVGDSPLVLVAAALASLGVARLSMVYVEEPIRRRRPRIRFATARLVAACLCVPLVGAFALRAGAADGWGHPEVRDFAAQMDLAHAPARACIGPDSVAVRDLRPCIFNAAGKQRPIVLIGDSNAFQFAPALLAVSRAQDRPLTIVANGGCPFVDVDIRRSGRLVDCSTQDGFAWLARQPSSVVVVAASNVDVDGVDSDLRASGTTTWATTKVAKQRVWERGLEATFVQLARAGHTVIEVGAIPHFVDAREGSAWSPRDCTLLAWGARPRSCGRSASLQVAQAHHLLGLRAEDAAARASGVELLDLSHVICPGDRCATNVGDQWFYVDGLHISPGLSARLAPDFAPAIARAAVS